MAAKDSLNWKNRSSRLRKRSLRKRQPKATVDPGPQQCKMNKQTVFLLVSGWLACGVPWEKVNAAEDPAHNELRALRTEIIDAITKGDFDRVVLHVHTNVVVTWQNNEVCRGHKGLSEFFHRMGKDTFKSYKVPPTPDELTILYGGNVGLSFGETVAQY